MMLLTLATFEAVYRSHHQAVERYLYRLTHDRDLAADLAQETFTRALAALQREERSVSLTWLYRIALYRVIDLHRRRCIIEQVPFTHLAADSASGEFDVADTGRETDFPERLAHFDLFRHVWEHLTPQEQHALVHSVMGTQTGGQTGCDKMRVYRARQRLRQMWRKEVAA